MYVSVQLFAKEQERAKKLHFGLWDFPSALATWNAKELLQTMEVLLLAICLQLECCLCERDG